MKICLLSHHHRSGFPPFCSNTQQKHHPSMARSSPSSSSLLAHPAWFHALPPESSVDSFRPDSSLFSSLNSVVDSAPPSPPLRTPPHLLVTEVNPTTFYSSSLSPTIDDNPGGTMHPHHLESAHILPPLSVEHLGALSLSDADSLAIPEFHHDRPSSAEISPSRVRLMCSFGGKIMARPLDGKLRYVGGETRIVAINRGILFEEFMYKMSQLYGSPLEFKYQLPDEDLDSLVSVSSDDDLQNMMEEYDKAEANSRIRLFFYSSPSELEVSGGLKADIDDVSNAFEQIFVDAVNGVAAEKLQSGLISENDATVGSKQAADSHSLEAGDVPGKILPPLESTDALHYSNKTLSVLSPSYPSSPPLVPRQPPGHQKPPLLDEANLHNLNEQSNKIAGSPRGLEGDAEPDMSGAASFRVSYLDHQFHHEYREHHICGPADIPKIPHHDQSGARTGTQRVDSTSSLLLQSAQNMDYRNNVAVPMDYRHDTQHYSDVYVSQIEHQHFIQKQHHVPLQQHHYHPPTNIPHQQQHPWQMPIDANSGHRPHEVYMQTQAFHQQHHYPSHHLSHHVPAVHDRSIEYHALHPLYQKHPQFLHGLPPAPPYPMDLTRVAVHDHHGRCSCGLQPSQVHRGITVCIGEPSSSSRWPGDQTFRKHGAFSSSRFPDGRSSFTDPSPWPHLVGTMEIEHKEQAVHPWQHIHQRHPVDGLTECQSRYSVSCYDHHMHNETYVPTPDSQDAACQGIAYFDNGKQIGNKGNPGGCDKKDQMSDWFLQHNTLETEHGRLDVPWKAFPRNSIGKDEDHRGEFPDEKSIDGESVLYRPQQLQIEPDSRMAMTTTINGMSHARKSPLPSVRPLVSEELQSTQLLSTHGIEWHPESVLSASSEMHEKRNAAYFEPHLMAMPSLCMQLNKSMEMEIGSRDKSFATGSLLMEEADTVIVSRKSAYIHGELGVICSNKKCDDKLNMQDVSTPSKIIDTESAVANAEIPEISEIQVQESVAVATPHMRLDIFTTSFNNAAMGDASATPTHAKTVINNNFSFFQSELSSESVVVTDKAQKDINELDSDFAVNVVPGDVNGLNVNLKCENGPEVDRELDKLPYSVTKERDCGNNLEVEEKSDIGTISHQVINVQSEKSCGEETSKPHLSQPEEEARARGLQIIKNADLEDLKELGSGTFGTVYHGKWRGSDVAIKRIKSSCFSGPPSEKDRLISDFWKEAGTLAQLHHPNVVAFYGVVPDGPEERTLATVTEYMVNGSLKQVLQKKDRTIDRRKRLLIAMDAAFGMEYLHSKNIVHFDLKCENLLVNMKDAHRPICKVGDFGLSKVKHQTLVSGGVRGTLPWMAPELLSGNSNMVTDKVDVYSFGIVMWELLTGEEPYANMQFGAIIRGIVDNTLRPSVPSWCDPGWRQLMEKCWSSDPAGRPSFTEVALELRSMAASMNIK